MNESREASMSGAGRVLIALLAGIAVVLGIWGGYTYWRNVQYRRTMEYGYRRAVQEASENLSNISTDLIKGMYAGTPAQLSQISAKLWKEAASAKSAISVLPVAELHLDKTNEFLSQVGDYAMYLSRKSSNGQSLTLEERQNFQRMREYADRLSDAVDDLEDSLERGDITFAEIERIVAQGQDYDNLDEEMPSIVTNTSLDAMEGGFSAYPSLIYDGPFSDHIMDRTPVITKNSAVIDSDQAREIARKTVGEGVNIQYMREENSNLPCYVFYSDDCSVAISKYGGQVCYVIYPEPEDIPVRMTPKQAIAAGQSYLQRLGISSMRETYYEIDDGMMTINFAYETDNVTCYTDLIKVDVSLSDGKVYMFDARGYLVNHQERNLSTPALTVEQAQQAVSSQLTVENTRLALIPTEGQNEVLCWEFTCTGTAGDHVLVYVNANNSAEEKILILIEDEDSVLTK